MLSLTFYYIWIRPSCCPYLERREAEKYLESVAETAHDNQTYTNINVVGISPGWILRINSIWKNTDFQVPERRETEIVTTQQQIEGSFLEYDDSVTIRNSQIIVRVSYKLRTCQCKGLTLTPATVQENELSPSRRPIQLPIAWE